MDDELKRQSAVLNRMNEDIHALGMQLRRLGQQVDTLGRNREEQPLARSPRSGLTRLLAVLGVFLLGAQVNRWMSPLPAMSAEQPSRYTSSEATDVWEEPEQTPKEQPSATAAVKPAPATARSMPPAPEAIDAGSFPPELSIVVPHTAPAVSAHSPQNSSSQQVPSSNGAFRF